MTTDRNSDPEEPRQLELEWQDYIALVSGLAQTVLLPFLLILLTLILLTILSLIIL